MMQLYHVSHYLSLHQESDAKISLIAHFLHPNETTDLTKCVYVTANRKEEEKGIGNRNRGDGSQF
jgi:hypothetical protein